MEGKDYRSILGEQGIEFAIRQAVRMFSLRQQPHEVNHIDDPHDQLRLQEISQQRIVEEMALPDREVVGCSPERVDPFQIRAVEHSRRIVQMVRLRCPTLRCAVAAVWGGVCALSAELDHVMPITIGGVC